MNKKRMIWLMVLLPIVANLMAGYVLLARPAASGATATQPEMRFEARLVSEERTVAVAVPAQVARGVEMGEKTAVWQQLWQQTGLWLLLLLLGFAITLPLITPGGEKRSRQGAKPPRRQSQHYV